MVKTTLYPSLQQPILDAAQRPETVTESRWHQPFSEPVRFKTPPRLAAALIASGCVLTHIIITPSTAFASGVSQPRKFVRPLNYPQVAECPFVAAPAETITVDKWYVRFTDPVKAKPRIHTEGVQCPLGWQVNPDSWYRQLSDPVRVKPAVSQQQDLAFVKADPFPETVSVDRWLYSLNEPIRVKLSLWRQHQQSLTFVKADLFPESVTIDRWLYPLNEPVRLRRSINQQPLSFVQSESVTGWLYPLSEPSRPKRSVAGQQFDSFVKAAPFNETVSLDRWQRPFNEPIRARWSPSLYQQYGTFVRVDQAPDVPVDRWSYAFSEPVRFKQALPAYKQQSLAYVEAEPFAEAVTLDRWFYPLNEPVRLKPELANASQRAFSFSFVISHLFITDTDILQNPVDCVLAGQQIPEERFKAWHVRNKVKYTPSKISRSRLTRLDD